MELTKKKLFIQLQFGMLLAAVASLPEFSLASLFNAPDVEPFGAAISKLLAVILGTIAVVKLYKANPTDQKQLPVYLIAIIGFLMVLLSVFGVSVVGTIGCIALIVAIVLSCKNSDITWNQAEQTIITFMLPGMVMYIYEFVNNTMLTSLAAIVGLILILIGSKRLKKLLQDKAAAGMSKYYTAAILGLIAIVISLLPLVGGIIATILNIIAFILMLVANINLKNVAPKANMLFLATILVLCGLILGLIPVIGDYILIIIAIVALYLNYVGWNSIAISQAAPAAPAEPAQPAEEPAHEPTQE